MRGGSLGFVAVSLLALCLHNLFGAFSGGHENKNTVDSAAETSEFKALSVKLKAAVQCQLQQAYDFPRWHGWFAVDAKK